MNHDMVVRQKTTERYLLGELSPEVRAEFEEHYFDCPDCGLDVRAAALFVEQSKVVLAEEPEPAAARPPVTGPAPAKPGWFAWFSPALGAKPSSDIVFRVSKCRNLRIRRSGNFDAFRGRLSAFCEDSAGEYVLQI